MKNTTKVFGIACLSLFAAFTVMNLSSCKEDPVTKKDKEPPASTKDYILFEGHKIEFRNPLHGDVSTPTGYTKLTWIGNQPSGVEGDTTFRIYHEKMDVNLTYKIWDDAMGEDEVSASFDIGFLDGKPKVAITGGDYKLTRENGVLISTLKNGTGRWNDDDGNLKKSYKGIEFRVEWPGL